MSQQKLEVKAYGLDGKLIPSQPAAQEIKPERTTVAELKQDANASAAKPDTSLEQQVLSRMPKPQTESAKLTNQALGTAFLRHIEDMRKEAEKSNTKSL